jgi:hypothetical protein
MVIAGVACGGPPAPGEEAFENASSQIAVHNQKTAFGNGPEAVKLAEAFGSTMKTMRQVLFSKSNGRGPSLTDGEFLTYCHLTEDGVLFLVHVPELRKFTEDAQKSLLELSWVTARSTTKEFRGKRNVKLGVGLRGALLFGGLAIGSGSSQTPEQQDTSAAVDVSAFYPFFVGQYPKVVTVASSEAQSQ